MHTLTASILIASIISLTGWAGSSIADEVVLCLSEENQYVVLVDGAGGCLDEESEIKISSTNINKTENLIPLATFSPNHSCEDGATGYEYHLGFDKNENGALDSQEIETSASSCTTIYDSEEAEDTNAD